MKSLNIFPLTPHQRFTTTKKKIPDPIINKHVNTFTQTLMIFHEAKFVPDNPENTRLRI